MKGEDRGSDRLGERNRHRKTERVCTSDILRERERTEAGKR